MNKDDIIKLAREAEKYADKHTPQYVTVPNEWQEIRDERFAALVAAAEREAIMDEWWMCVQSDLENGVKSLNERAAEKWHKEYPAIAGFAAAIRARGNKI